MDHKTLFPVLEMGFSFSTLIIFFLHSMAKLFRHQATKTQRKVFSKQFYFVPLGLCGNFSGLSGLGIS